MPAVASPLLAVPPVPLLPPLPVAPAIPVVPALPPVPASMPGLGTTFSQTPFSLMLTVCPLHVAVWLMTICTNPSYPYSKWKSHELGSLHWLQSVKGCPLR